MNAEEVHRSLQRIARSDAAKSGSPLATQAYLTRHALESFLERLSRTQHARDFVLKGGLLLGAYGVRRPTKDADSNAISADITPDFLCQVVRDIAQTDAEDGVVFDLDTLSATVIREAAEYPGIRLRVRAAISNWRGFVAWDVSTGDPIVPSPQPIVVNRLLGQPISLIGYTPEGIVAEKGVTILERGVANTRWRDYVDIVLLGELGLDPIKLAQAVRAVAEYRNVILKPLAEVITGYEAIAQAKWAAWRRKEGLALKTEEKLDEQMLRVAAILDPAFTASRD